MAGQSFVQLASDGAGKKMDTQITSTAAQHRQVMVIGAKDTDANVAPVDATNGLAVQVIPALPAGTNVIGHVIADSGSTTAVTGNVATTTADGASVTLGSKADAKSTATDTTAITVMQVLKQISASVQAPPAVSGTVTANAGTNLNTSTLALETGGNLATVAGGIISQEATTSGVKGLTAFGAVTTAKPTYTTAKSDALSLDTNGLLRVSLADTPANGTKFLVTPDSVALPANQSVNVSQVNGVTPLMGNGVTGTGSMRVTIASDNTANSNPFLVSEIPTTSGGVSTYSFLSTPAVQTAQIKGSAGQVYGIHFWNNSATIAYVRIYNQTGAPASTDGANIVWRGMVPANTSGAGFVIHMEGTACGTGIGIRVTAAIADNDATALAANVIIGNVLYK